MIDLRRGVAVEPPCAHYDERDSPNTLSSALSFTAVGRIKINSSTPCSRSSVAHRLISSSAG
jgi:hypothetical protein